jgi:hypothetical protein
MSLLGDFLESFYGSGGQPQTIWAQLRRERKASKRGAPSRRAPIGRKKLSAGEAMSIVDMEFWAKGETLVRVDTTPVIGGDEGITAEAVKNRVRTKRLADGSVEVDRARMRRRDADDLPTEFRRHFDRRLIREFFSSLTLADLGETHVAGRPCVRMRAIPLDRDSIWPHWLSTDADEFEFAADLEFPSLLSIGAKLGGEVFETFETTCVTFNGVIDETLFDLEPLFGRTARDAVPVTERITLEAATKRAPFTIVLPKLPPNEGEPDFHYHPVQGRRTAESLTVFYNGPRKYWFSLTAQRDERQHETHEWEEIELSGRRFYLSDPEVEGGLKILVFCHEGTWVDIDSDWSREDLLKSALSFEKVGGGAV